MYSSTQINSCLAFPESFSTNAGISNAIPDSANLTQTFAKGDITASAIVEIVDQYVSAVYGSSSGLDVNPYGCDVNGLATLSNCKSATDTAKSLRPDGDIVKAVTLAGAFVPHTWATNGKVLSMEEVKDFYPSKDFRQMADLGVNTVQIPVPCDTFYKNGEMANTVSYLLSKADKAGLSAIIVLVAPDTEEEGITDEMVDEHVKSAAAFASDSSTVIALQLPSQRASLLSAVRSEDEKLPVLVPTKVEQLENLSFPPDSYLFAALDVTSTTSVAGVASSDSEGDRMKMFYRKFHHLKFHWFLVRFHPVHATRSNCHSFLMLSTISIPDESITCIDRSPIEWLECYRDMPVYVTGGFDLAIDNCIDQEEKGFKDYGQVRKVYTHSYP